MRNGYVVKKPKNATGYVILPTVYAKGMHAQVDGKEVPVHQANGIMTAIPVNKGDKVIKLTYTSSILSTCYYEFHWCYR